MPTEGIELVEREQILRLEEFYSLTKIFAKLGITKIRVTGGEPLLRTKLLDFLGEIKKIKGIEEVHITTNGVLLLEHIDSLKRIDINGVNLSLDTFKANRFIEISRGTKQEHQKILEAITALKAKNIPLKLNCVVQDINADEIGDFVKFSQAQDLEVRFIEQMPFNGSFAAEDLIWDSKAILAKVKASCPEIELVSFNSTAYIYAAANKAGKIGIIEGNSRSFCDSCSRLRLTAKGMLNTCLYGPGDLNLKELLRSGLDHSIIQERIKEAAFRKYADGFVANQAQNKSQEKSLAMVSIGG